MDGPLEWVAAIGTIIAAAMVASDLGRRVTGAGFVLFSVVAVLWVYSGLTAPDGMPLAVQNGILLLVNLFGVYRFLLSRRNVAIINRMERAAPKIEEQVDEILEREEGQAG